MKATRGIVAGSAAVALMLPLAGSAERPGSRPLSLEWQVVVNNGVTVPGDARTFNSYNQPSVNVDGLVVFRGRSRGGQSGEPAHGVYVRDMALRTAVERVFDRARQVPHPNNLGTTFVEPPSFPRIDLWSNTIASRGNHPPAWRYQLSDGSETRGGTTGIYTNPFATLIAGASNIGGAQGFEFFAVPGAGPLKFDVFPGAPAVTDRSTIVFKGNYTSGGVAHTGVYYRDLADSPAGGSDSVVPIADTHTLIPRTQVTFGSTAPPSAVGRTVVFAGFDNEDNPTCGGIYRAELNGPFPKLKTLVSIGARVPGEKKGNVFNRLGEGLSFDGRFVAFWGAWGDEVQTLVLQCPDEGNKDRVAFCKAQYPNGFTTTVPRRQGIFVHDTQSGETVAVARTPLDFTDFVYWNFSGMVPGTGESDETGEPARWRSATFLAASGMVDDRLTDPAFHAAFKARTGQVVNGAYSGAVDGIYLAKGPDVAAFTPVVESGMDGTQIDPAAVDTSTQLHLPVTEMGLERDGFRGRWLAINASMGTEEAGWSGIYLTAIPQR